MRLEPLLETISISTTIECIRRDLVRGLKQPGSGRHGLTATQVLRSLVLMRLKNWDYRELRERIADGLTLRQFTDFYCAPVPKHDAFQRGFIRLTPQTLKAVNDLVVRAAVELELEDGAKLRVDTTVVQTDIHHPTDNTLLWDVVRVVTRLVSRLAKALELRQIKGADVVVTVTPSREPLVKDEWIAPGTHIAAVGADKAGDQELDPRILQRARIFVDDIRQCRTDGEINVPLSKGLIREEDIAGDIGEVITRKKQGRRSDDEITLFDSTGIALQDSATVPLEYERAVAAGVGIEKKMIST